MEGFGQPSIANSVFASMTWRALWRVWRVSLARMRIQRGSGFEIFLMRLDPFKPSIPSIQAIKYLIYFSYFQWIVLENYPSTLHNPPFDAKGR